MAELIIEKVSKRFGGLLAVENLDLQVPQGEILSLIGPNGAGKTTVFNMITGVYPPTEGAITYKGHKLNNLRSNRIIAHGIARTFQNIRLFKSMTVLENVQVGMHCRTRSGPVRALLKTRFEKHEEQSISEKAFEILLTSEQTSVLHIIVKKDVKKLKNIPWHPIEIKNKILNRHKG